MISEFASLVSELKRVQTHQRIKHSTASGRYESCNWICVN